MRIPRFWALAALALVGLPTVAQERATRSALIIGVSSYASPAVPTLAGVPFDIASAKRIASAMGVAQGRTTVLLDAQSTKANILAELDRLGRSTAEGDRVFVYFSGHGTRWFDAALGGCKEGLLARDGLTLTNEDVARHTRKMSESADKVIVMFDACFSNGVNSTKGASRSIDTAMLKPKFYLRAGDSAQACAASNVRTRGLLAETTRLGALPENFVQISSSLADEVSFDEADKGGVATQAVRDCLLGARDLDGSGAVSMREVETCSQQLVNAKIAPFIDLKPQHISVSGNRNVVPVAVVRPPPDALPPALQAAPAALPPQPPAAQASAAAPVAATESGAAPAAPTAPAAPAAIAVAIPPAPAPAPAAPAAPDSSAATVAASASAATGASTAATALPQTPAPSVVKPAAAALASLVTLKEIEAQRNPRRPVDVALNRSAMKIGRDPLALTLRSSHDGYVYLVLLGSDAKSFYLLFPNGHDADNRIRAGQAMSLPRPDWALVARGPAGTDRLLVLVTDTPRDLSALALSPPDAVAPYTFALNNLQGRAALIDFLTGAGVTGRSESFGAKLLAIRETP